ncbi:MAG: winged helix-turn-helix transcriptional regulator [Prolixibacteraceae bacterium]|nr:winged helix-turn-helix transcriptional regulator [Prolixibacteraceae bacterium]
MVQSKTELFDKELQQSSEFFKALAHPARLQILKYLAETKTCITGDISEELPLSRTTVNQHLTELKKAGLIQGHVSGVKMNYCLNLEKIDEMKQSLLSFIDEIQIENFKCK